MFHRVKSETSEQEKYKQQQIEAQEEQDETSAADEQALEEETAESETDQDDEQETLEEDTLSSQDDEEETSQNEKETTSMNTLVQNRTEEAAEEQETQYGAPAGYQQRAAQIPTGYTGYTAPTAPVAPVAPSTPAASERQARDIDVSAGRTLTVGVGINMSGEIDSCDHLVVEGTVEAALKGASVLDIAESGTFFGSVEIEEATVAGRFEGEIIVHGRLTIRSGGVITGSISYKELEVEAGAVLDGRITPVREQNRQSQPAEKVQAGRQASQMAKAKQTGSKQNAANAEGSLFVAAKA